MVVKYIRKYFYMNIITSTKLLRRNTHPFIHSSETLERGISGPKKETQ